jgi:hypothetical protein
VLQSLPKPFAVPLLSNVPIASFLATHLPHRGACPSSACEAMNHVVLKREQTEKTGETSTGLGYIWVFVVGSYFILAMIANLPAWLHGPTSELPLGGGLDVTQQVWFLGFTPDALIHGDNPFIANWINFPYGVNLMANISMFLPSLVLSPVTLIWGPVASFNVLMVIGFAGSATSAFAVFRHWVSWTPAAYVGGLVYGFSPFAVAEGSQHLFLQFAVLPPLFLLVLERVLFGQRGSPVRRGVVLGVLASAQLLISMEVLSSTAVLSAIGLILVFIFCWSRAGELLWRAATAFGTAIVTFLIVCAYPLWVYFYGPEHTTGTVHPSRRLDAFSTDALGLFLPTSNQAISPAALQHISHQFVNRSNVEDGSYVGLVLLVVLVIFTVVYWRVAVVRFAAAMSVVVVVLSCGPSLRVDGHTTGLDLPFFVLTRFPLLDDQIAVRYTLYICLFAGLLLAVGLDRLQRTGIGPIKAGNRSSFTCAVIAVACLVPLAPRWPYPILTPKIPAYFRSGANSIPAGSVVLTYPFPRGASHDQPMLWQIEGGLNYRLPGGYVITAGHDDKATTAGGRLPIETLLEETYKGRSLPFPSKGEVAEVVRDLRTWDIDTIVVTSEERGSASVDELFTVVLGRPPTQIDGADVWYHVGPQLDSTGTAPATTK